MSGDMSGRVAVVTGAGGDVGGAASVLFAERGAAVVAVDINQDGLAALGDRMPEGVRLTTVIADVRDEAAVAHYVAVAVETYGGIDCFFNNAGTEGTRTGAWRPLMDLSVEDFRFIIDVNARGVFLGLKHVLPVMAAAGRGAIVNTASINGLKGARNQVAYVASKHAVRGMTVAAAREWAGRGIRVNAVAPGAIEGRMLRDFVEVIHEYLPPPDPEQPMRYNPPPIERWSDPREIAQVVAFLCSDAASYVTGATYSVDGGLIAI